jgi:hypothetical protein
MTMVKAKTIHLTPKAPGRFCKLPFPYYEGLIKIDMPSVPGPAPFTVLTGVKAEDINHDLP